MLAASVAVGLGSLLLLRCLSMSAEVYAMAACSQMRILNTIVLLAS